MEPTRKLLHIAMLAFLVACGEGGEGIGSDPAGVIAPPANASFSHDLGDYTEDEIWDMYVSGEIEDVFETSIDNFIVDPKIFPDHIVTEMSFDYVGSRQSGEVTASLESGGQHVSTTGPSAKNEGGFYFGIPPTGTFAHSSFEIQIPGSVGVCGIANRGWAKAEVNSGTTLSVRGIGITWGEKMETKERIAHAPLDWCDPEPPPSDPPSGSTQGLVEEGEDCFVCVTTYWIDSGTGEVVHVEHDCEPTDPEECEGLPH